MRREEPTVQELRERVFAHGRGLSATVDVLGARIQRAVDWREQAARHPYLVLAAAAGTGLLAARLLPHRVTAPDRSRERVSTGFQEVVDRLRSSRRPTRPSRSTVLGPLTRGLLGILATAALRHAGLALESRLGGPGSRVSPVDGA